MRKSPNTTPTRKLRRPNSNVTYSVTWLSAILHQVQHEVENPCILEANMAPRTLPKPVLTRRKIDANID
eukprot:12407025-Karenia_brevis.AAC.1